MHHLIVDAGANTAAKAVVTLKTRHCIHGADALLGIGIQISGGHAWFHHAHDFLEHSCHNPACLAHDRDLPGRLQLHPPAVLADARPSLGFGRYQEFSK